MSNGAQQGDDWPAEADSEKAGSSGHHVLRWMTVVGAVLLPWSWYRHGLTPSGDYPDAGGLAMAAVALFLLGAVVYGTTVRGAAVALGLAMAARGYVELRLSVLKQLAWWGELDDLSHLPWLVVTYSCTFIAPSLLLIDAVREWARGRRESVKQEEGEETC